MSSNPLVSIVIPCYNHEHYVQDSIRSVIDQTYKNIELIIIDDGSKDCSVVKIKEMISICEQRFVKFEFRSRPNKGLSSTLNEAIEWCRGDYYSVIASDDMMLKNKTEVQVNLLNENEDITAIFGGVILIDDNNNEVGHWLSGTKQYDFKTIILHQHDLPAPTQMIRLESIKKVGGYNPNIILEDWYMWLKLSEFSNILYTNEILSFYRQHDTNISKNMKKIHQGRIDVLNCFKDSKYYKKAMHNINWINVNEKYSNDEKYQFNYFKEAFPIKPFKVANKFFKHIIRIIKNKLRASYS